MKIKRIKSKTGIRLECIGVGHTFQTDGGTVYMKIREFEEMKTGYIYNAVEIETGELEGFNHDIYVNLVDAELIVTE